MLAKGFTFRALGYGANSYGYNGCDGRIACHGKDWEAYGPQYNTGDIVGCGLVKGNLFYTKNGEFLGVAHRDVSGVLYPSVSLYGDGYFRNNPVVANFGQTRFVFKMDCTKIN